MDRGPADQSTSQEFPSTAMNETAPQWQALEQTPDELAGRKTVSPSDSAGFDDNATADVPRTRSAAIASVLAELRIATAIREKAKAALTNAKDLNPASQQTRPQGTQHQLQDALVELSFEERARALDRWRRSR